MTIVRVAAVNDIAVASRHLVPPVRVLHMDDLYEGWAGLGDGYQLDARIEVFAEDQTIVVPVGALFRRGENWSVFVVENGRAQPRQVTLTRRSGRVAAISAGVNPGDRVVVYPSDRVTAGGRVEAR